MLDSLLQVLAGKSAKQVAAVSQAKLVEQQQGLYSELFLGVLRQWFVLEGLLASYINRPLTEAPSKATLYLGAYQLLFTNQAEHASIFETIEQAKLQRINKAHIGLINAVLRQVQLSKAVLQAKAAEQHGLPQFLYQQLQRDWGKQLSIVLAQVLLTKPPIYVCLPAQNIDEATQSLLAATALAHCYQFTGGGAITQLSAFANNACWVQDLHAQLAAHWLGPIDGGMRVLDACVAPGGKCMQLLALNPTAHITALDIEPERLQTTAANLQRMGLHARATLLCGDALQHQTAKPYQRILLDAPCSATGIMRRQSDVRLHRSPADIQRQVALQAALLDHLWTQLDVGGELLYITCSILKAENETQIGQFLQRTPNAAETKLSGQLPSNNHVAPAYWGENRPFGRQCMPTPNGGDGFYYAKLTKTAP